MTVASSAFINLALLVIFKYTDFFIRSINSLTGSGIPLLGLALPIGISFYTFQTMSYTFDVYRGTIRAERHLGTTPCLSPSSPSWWRDPSSAPVTCCPS